MKKRLTFLIAALLLMSGLTWAQNITWTASEQGYQNGQAIESVTFDSHVSAGFFQGTNSNNAPKYYNTGEAIRCYGGNYFTVTSDCTLTEITLGFATGEGSNAITTNCGTYEDGTWTGNANEVTFSVDGTSGHRRIASFAISYTQGLPTITAANVEIAYDATSGTIEYTINNEVTGGLISASTTADWLTIGTVGTTVPFTCTANPTAAPRTATVVLTYTYNTDQTATKNVTVTQAANPNAVNNISDITAAGTYTVQGTIVAKSQRGFIVGDGTGYVYYYNQNYTEADYLIGDMVKLAGPVVVYGGVFEFNSSTTITAATSSNYVAEDPTELSGADMDARVASTTPAQLSNYVQYEGTLTVNGTHYNITEIVGATTALGSVSYPLSTDEIVALDGKHVKVTGYYVGISTGTYYNTMLGSIEEIATSNPSITAENVSIDYNATSGAIEYTIENAVNGGILTAATESEWLTLGAVGTTVPFTCTANNTASARTATVTLTYTYNTDQIITKNLTVTQAGNPNAIDNISDITAAGTYTVQGTIVAISNRGFILGDGTGYVYYYYGSTGFDPSIYLIGDMVRLAGSVVVYGGVFEFNNTTTITAATSSNYVDEDPTVLSGADIDARVASTTPAQLSNYVQYEGTLSVSGTYYNITDIAGAQTAKGSISFPIDTEFASLDGKLVKVTGYYVGVSSSTYYNTMLGSIEEIASTTPTITVNQSLVEVTADEIDGTLTVTYQNIDTDLGGEILWYAADGTTAATYDWISAELDEDMDLYYMIDANEGEARTAYFKVSATGTDGIVAYSNLVTVSQAAVVLPFEPATYTLATTIESGKTYIIVGSKTIDEETHYFAMGEQKNNNRAAYEISVDGTTALVDTAAVHEVVITALDSLYSIYDGGYLYAAGSNNNYLRTNDELDVNGQWEISIDSVFHIVASNSENRNVMQFNYGSLNNPNPLFSCYSSESQSPVYLYVKDEPVTTITQTVALSSGTNWFSSYVEITLDDLKAALVEALPNTEITIQAQKNNAKYNPSNNRWTGRLNSLDLSNMYKISVEDACEFTLEGMPVDPTEHPVTIDNGANWIAFPLQTSMTPTDAFTGFAVGGDRIQSFTNNANYNGSRWTGQLRNLDPGQGYIYQSAAAETRTFTFPTSAKKTH